MARESKGMRALHSVSGGVVSAIRQLHDDEYEGQVGFPSGGATDVEQAIAEALAAEQPKPVDRQAPRVPALIPSAISELDRTSAEVEAQRQREYAVITEIDAELATAPDLIDGLIAARDAAQGVVDKAEADIDALTTRNNDLKKLRQEAAERAIAQGQMLLDNEAARLRRGL